jgi:hypothetical protein
VIWTPHLRSTVVDDYKDIGDLGLILFDHFVEATVDAAQLVQGDVLL